jgi:hypothetical protein
LEVVPGFLENLWTPVKNHKETGSDPKNEAALLTKKL